VAPTLTEDRPVAPIDPRIRARRIEVQRGEGRRRLQRLVDVGVVVAVAAGFFVALRSPLLDVDEVVVAGAEQTGADAVRTAAAIEPGTQLADVDLRGAGERVAALPWVDEVRVDRGLDGVIALVVTERAPVALVGSADAAVVVDLDGRVVARAADVASLPAGLVRLTGVDDLAPGQGLPTQGRAALPLAARLASVVPGAVVELAVDDLVGTLGTGGEVRFGDDTQIDAKVRSLQTVLAQVDLTCLGTLDVGSPGSPVLTREEGCS
jgi:cell division protein FtsQ